MQINEVVMLSVKAIFDVVGSEFTWSKTTYGRLYKSTRAIDKDANDVDRYLFLYVDDFADGSMGMSAYLDNSKTHTDGMKIETLRIYGDTTIKQLGEFIGNCTRYKCPKN